MNNLVEEQNAKASEWIDGIIRDLTDDQKSLEDCLRKTLVLAYTIQNESLRTWVNNELNSYPDEVEVPKYRTVGVEIRGDVAQATFSALRSRQNMHIHFEGSSHPYFKELSAGFKLRSNVGSLLTIGAKQSEEGGAYLSFQVSPHLFGALEKLYSGWRIEEARILVSNFTITEVLSIIKTSLLQFLLEINSSINSNPNYSIMSNSDKVNELIKETIGYINAENVTFGNNYQVKGNDNNVAQGENINQNNVNYDNKEVVNMLLTKVAELVSVIGDDKLEEKKAINDQVEIIRDQMGREEPNNSILSTALKMCENILVSITANVYQPGILEYLSHAIEKVEKSIG